MVLPLLSWSAEPDLNDFCLALPILLLLNMEIKGECLPLMECTRLLLVVVLKTVTSGGR